MEYDPTDKARRTLKRPCQYDAFCIEPAIEDQYYCPTHMWRYFQRHGAKRKSATAAKRSGKSGSRFRKQVMKRAGGQCEACRVDPFAGCDGTAVQAHHVLPLSVGVELGWPLVNDADANGLAVSDAHHLRIHSDGFRIVAFRLGLLADRPDSRTPWSESQHVDESGSPAGGEV